MAKNQRDGDRGHAKSKKPVRMSRSEALVEKMKQGRVKLGLGEFGMDEADRQRYLEEEAAERAAAEAKARAEQGEDSEEEEEEDEEEEEEPRKRGKKGKKFMDKSATLSLIDEVTKAQKVKEKSSREFSANRVRVLQERQKRRERRKEERAEAANAAMKEARQQLQAQRAAARRERREEVQREAKRIRREAAGKPSVRFA